MSKKMEVAHYVDLEGEKLDLSPFGEAEEKILVFNSRQKIIASVYVTLKKEDLEDGKYRITVRVGEFDFGGENEVTLEVNGVTGRIIKGADDV